MLSRVAFLLVFLTGSAIGLTVSPAAVEQALSEATLVADIAVDRLESFADETHFATFRATATVIAVHSDRTAEVRTGDRLVITGPGGERDGYGLFYSGVPKPHKGKRYRAHLRRQGDTYTVTGYDAGLVAFDGHRAYTRNRTDGSDGSGDGPFLFWDNTYFPLPFYISKPTFLDQPAFLDAVDASFKTWRDILDIKVEFLPMGCSSGVKNENDGLNHVILVKDEWKFGDPNVIAITRNFYISGTAERAGMILDSDILLNGVNHGFTVTAEPGKNDIQNILTHEIGHVLGLGHETSPADSDATMFANATTNETKKRELKANDLEGIHAAYAGVGQKFQWVGSQCNVDSDVGSCLAVHQPTTSSGVPTLGFASAVILLLFMIGRRYAWQ